MIVDSDGLDLTSVSLPGWSFMPEQGTVRTVLYSTVQYCTVLYSTVQCCTVDIHIRISVCGIHGSLAVACGVLGRTPTPKAGANACGGLWRRKICDRRVAAGFGNAIRAIYHSQGRCKRLRWPVGTWGPRPPPRPVQAIAVACAIKFTFTMYIHIYIHIHIYMHVYIHIYIHVYIHFYIYIHIYIHICIHIYIHIHMYVHIHIYSN